MVHHTEKVKNVTSDWFWADGHINDEILNRLNIRCGIIDRIRNKWLRYFGHLNQMKDEWYLMIAYNGSMYMEQGRGKTKETVDWHDQRGLPWTASDTSEGHVYGVGQESVETNHRCMQCHCLGHKRRKRRFCDFFIYRYGTWWLSIHFLYDFDQFLWLSSMFNLFPHSILPFYLAQCQFWLEKVNYGSTSSHFNSKASCSVDSGTVHVLPCLMLLANRVHQMLP